MSDPSPAPHLLQVDITTPEGRLRGNLAVPARPIRLAELAYNVLPLDEQLVKMSVRKHAPDPEAISCRKGCGACCSQVVPLSPPEAWMLYDLVRGLPEERKARALDRFRAAGEALAAAGLTEVFSRSFEGEEAMRAAAVAYFRMGVPCPFLEDQACSIHPHRPSVCREYLVTSPAEHCAELGRRPVKRVKISVRMSEALARVAARLLGSEEPVLIPMVMALDWAAAHAEEGQRRWDARELLGMLLEELNQPPEAGQPGPAAARRG